MDGFGRSRHESSHLPGAKGRLRRGWTRYRLRLICPQLTGKGDRVSDTIDAARKTIEDRIATLQDELKQLESAAAALGGRVTSRARAAGRTSSRPRRRASSGTGRRGRP